MASFPELRNSTTTTLPLDIPSMTSADPDKWQPHEEPPMRLGRETVSKVTIEEKGEIESDSYSSDERLEQGIVMVRVAAEKRKKMAGGISKAFERLGTHCGKARAAADLQLLKRELARCHEELGPYPSESNFLSIVVLLELELGKKAWNAISKEELLFLKRAADIGISKDQITFDDYNFHLRTLNSSGYRTGPILDFDGTFEDIPIDE